jgi:hypothetical protein
VFFFRGSHFWSPDWLVRGQLRRFVVIYGSIGSCGPTSSLSTAPTSLVENI